jgi:Uma2 family endonuclease
MLQNSVNASELALKRWTVNDYHRMIAAGILTSGDRVELINGQIIQMVPQDPPHASTADEGADYLKACFAKRAKVRVQLPITLAPDSEPEPDFAIVRLDHRYRDRHPEPVDIYFLIEISDSTFYYDRNRKAKIYASAGIPEYWIIHLKQKQVIMLRQPVAGVYQREQVFTGGDRIAPLAFPDILVDVPALFLNPVSDEKEET